MIKADLHLHTNEDEKDRFIKYSAKELIEIAGERGYDALAITLHQKLFYNEEIVQHAKKHGVTLIPGVEAVIEGRDVLLYNLTPQEYSRIKTFKDLRRAKERNKYLLVIAPHPFLPRSPINFRSLREKLLENIDLFDALEITAVFPKPIDINKKTFEVARKYNKPLVANSDLHYIDFLGHNFTLIDAIKNPRSIVMAIKKGHTRVFTNHYSYKEFFKLIRRTFIGGE